MAGKKMADREPMTAFDLAARISNQIKVSAPLFSSEADRQRLRLAIQERFDAPPTDGDDDEGSVPDAIVATANVSRAVGRALRKFRTPEDRETIIRAIENRLKLSFPSKG